MLYPAAADGLILVSILEVNKAPGPTPTAMANKVFISYASADQDTANKLVSEIERRGIPCWISSRNIRPGEDYQRAIVTAIETSGAVLLLFSQHANESVEIPKELAIASKFRKTIIPARVEDIVPSGSFAYQITTAQFIDLFRGFEKQVEELCAYLAEMLQVSEEVRERISKERKHKESKRKVMRFAIAALVILLIAVGAWTLGPRLKDWMSHPSSSSSAPAAPPIESQPQPNSSAPKSAQSAPLTNAAPPPASDQSAPSTAPPANAVPEPAAPQPAASSATPSAAATVPASRIFGGIRFDVKSIDTSNIKAPKVLISATNTQQRAMKFKVYAPPNPVMIDNNGIASTNYRVEGVALCTSGYNFASCSTPNANQWSEAYQGTPLNIVITFSSAQDFRGSSASISFDVLLGVEKDDGSIKATIVPVDLPNVPMRPGVPARPALASQTYGGITFGVTFIQADDKVVRVLIAATNTQQQNLRFKVYAPPLPVLIDSNGIASTNYRVDGVVICTSGYNFGSCSTPDPNLWSEVYPGTPLDILLTFSGPQDFRGSSASVSFDVLLGAEKDDGSVKSMLVPVDLPNISMNPDAPTRRALVNRTYDEINFDVMSVQTDDKAIRVLVAATNTQQRGMRFKVFAPPDPKAIDSNGATSSNYRVDGVMICTSGYNLASCSTPDPNLWSEAYPRVPLNLLLTFRGPQDFRGASANISFDVLLGAEMDDGSVKAKVVPVVLPNAPISH